MGMKNCKTVKTPVDPCNHLMKADENEEGLDQQLYQSLVGRLMYPATCTRSDIAYAVGSTMKRSIMISSGMIAKFSSKPK